MEQELAQALRDLLAYLQTRDKDEKIFRENLLEELHEINRTMASAIMRTTGGDL